MIKGLAVMVAAVTAFLAAALGDSSKVSSRDGLVYQWIPPGSYMTGCLPGDLECYGLERRPEKIVIAGGFWIGRTEVTQAAYLRVMNADPSYYKGGDLPVDRVGWGDATEYCGRIGMRLPTESEWEYAAYGGKNALPEQPLISLAWFDRNSDDHTHPVATKLPNGYGVWDMLGNVWEWVQDAGKEPGEHILKGGSFYNIARDIRVSGRLSAPSDLRHRDLGFRCASLVWPEGPDTTQREDGVPDEDYLYARRPTLLPMPKFQGGPEFAFRTLSGSGYMTTGKGKETKELVH